MDEYMVRRLLDGKHRKLVITIQLCNAYEVYWDSIYLGKIRPVLNGEIRRQWTSDDEFLGEYAQELGEYIEGLGI